MFHGFRFTIYECEEKIDTIDALRERLSVADLKPLEVLTATVVLESKAVLRGAKAGYTTTETQWSLYGETPELKRVLPSILTKHALGMLPVAKKEVIILGPSKFADGGAAMFVAIEYKWMRNGWRCIVYADSEITDSKLMMQKVERELKRDRELYEETEASLSLEATALEDETWCPCCYKPVNGPKQLLDHKNSKSHKKKEHKKTTETASAT